MNPQRAHSSELCSGVSEQSGVYFHTDRRIPRSSASRSFNHRNFLIPALVAAMVITVLAQSSVTKTFTVGGTTHSCIWHAPSGISNPPVVFFIHGANGSGGAFQTETKADVVADREKFITVYPSASNNGATGTWADMSGTGNFPFFLAVLDTLDNRYHIDRNRVYMTGFSQGGFISFVAGCKYSDVFAAIAPVSGHAGSSCTLKRPVPMFLTFGAQEDKVSFVADLNIWLKLDTCPSTPTKTSPFSGVTRITYASCANGSSVIMDSISGQQHQWPTKLNQAEEVWTFFKQFSLPTTTGVHRQFSSMPRQPVSASYSSGIVRLQGTGEKCRVRVTDTRGRLITSAITMRGRFAITDKTSGAYVVQVSENARQPVAIKMVIP